MELEWISHFGVLIFKFMCSKRAAINVSPTETFYEPRNRPEGHILEMEKKCMKVEKFIVLKFKLDASRFLSGDSNQGRLSCANYATSLPDSFIFSCPLSTWKMQLPAGLCSFKQSKTLNQVCCKIQSDIPFACFEFWLPLLQVTPSELALPGLCCPLLCR